MADVVITSAQNEELDSTLASRSKKNRARRNDATEGRLLDVAYL